MNPMIFCCFFIPVNIDCSSPTNKSNASKIVVLYSAKYFEENQFLNSLIRKEKITLKALLF